MSAGTRRRAVHPDHESRPDERGERNRSGRVVGHALTRQHEDDETEDDEGEATR